MLQMFPRIVDQTLDRSGKIRFNLDGVNIRNALASGARAMDDSTAWKLRQIVRNHRWFSNTVFYQNGRRLDPKDIKRLMKDFLQ